MSEELQRALQLSVNTWVDECLTPAVQNEAGAAGGGLPELTDAQLLERLRARFDDLDQHPKDGVITIDEVRLKLKSPPSNFDHIDLAMLQLLVRYYDMLGEMCDEEAEQDRGISHDDLDILELCLTSSNAKSMLSELEVHVNENK